MSSRVSPYSWNWESSAATAMEKSIVLTASMKQTKNADTPEPATTRSLTPAK